MKTLLRITTIVFKQSITRFFQLSAPRSGIWWIVNLTETLALRCWMKSALTRSDEWEETFKTLSLIMRSFLKTKELTANIEESPLWKVSLTSSLLSNVQSSHQKRILHGSLSPRCLTIKWTEKSILIQDWQLRQSKCQNKSYIGRSRESSE